jgi:hypothetical protein
VDLGGGAPIVPQERAESPEVARLGVSLQAALASAVAGSDEPVRLQLAAQSGLDALGTAATAASLAMIEGRVRTEADLANVQQEYINARYAEGNRALAPLLVHVRAEGGRVLGVNPLAATARVELPGKALAGLAARPELARAELDDRAPQDDTNPGQTMTITAPSINGRERNDLVQIVQFYNDGYEGENHVGTIAMVEQTGDSIFRHHPGFKNAAGTQRVSNCDEYNGNCVNLGPSSGDQHATAVASIILGDVTRGQDADLYAPSYGYVDRSGIARKAIGLGLDWNDSEEDWAIEQVVDPANNVHIVNISSSKNGDDDGTCSGASVRDRDWDAVFESGVAIFKSAGNAFHNQSTNCTIGVPGSAMGVFTVGAHRFEEEGSNTVDLIYGAQSLGGTSTEGRGRSIIDLNAPTRHEYPYRKYDSSGLYGADWPDETGTFFHHTSGSTPVVTGTAALLREWYRTEKSALIDDPAVLYTNLLLMGDGWNGTSQKTTGFDSLWGAAAFERASMTQMAWTAPRFGARARAASTTGRPSTSTLAPAP